MSCPSSQRRMRRRSIEHLMTTSHEFRVWGWFLRFQDSSAEKPKPKPTVPSSKFYPGAYFGNVEKIQFVTILKQLAPLLVGAVRVESAFVKFQSIQKVANSKLRRNKLSRRLGRRIASCLRNGRSSFPFRIGGKIVFAYELACRRCQENMACRWLLPPKARLFRTLGGDFVFHFYHLQTLVSTTPS